MLTQTVMATLDLANVEALAIASPGGQVLHVTSALLRRWGVSANDLLGLTLNKYGIGKLFARHLATALSSDQRQRIEVSYVPVLGDVAKASFTVQPIKQAGEEAVLLVGQTTTSVDAAFAVENEKRLRLALRSGGYAWWDYDHLTGKTTNSPEMYEMFGYPEGSSELEFHNFNRLLHPEDAVHTISAKTANATSNSDLFQTRYRVKCHSGSYVWIETVAGVIRDPSSGKVIKTVGLCRNIDSQVISMERLRSSERNLKRSQAIAKIGSFSLRVDSNVSRLTAELVTLIGMQDARVHPNLNSLIKLIEPGDREKFNEALELAKLGTKVKNLEIAVKLESGETSYFEVFMEPEIGPSGKIETIFGSCQSVTDRKALERKFHQAQKMEAVGQLTGGIAHDFNNLLMVVMGNLQLVEQLVKNDERALKRIRAAIEAAEKGSDLIRRMLAFSRQQTLQNKEIIVDELVFSMKDMLSQALTAIVSLKIIPGTDIWPVKADRTMLETAILNLAINARDAMQPKGGELIIETNNRVLTPEDCAQSEDVTPGDYVEIAVTDTGSGIAPEDIEKVFQPFFTTKGPEKGSGLGLSMIYGFVKQSGGHVKIYSEVGHGTTVKLFLPRLRSHGASSVRPSAPPLHTVISLNEPSAKMETEAAQAPSSTAKQIILVVEDNDSVREVAAAMIEEMGYEVLTAVNGPEGLKTIEQREDIKLVLSDVIMAGGMNGPELAAKAVKVRPNLKVLFMSGYAPGSVRLMQDLPDTIELVNKPFTRNDLTEKVRRALAA